MAELGITIEQRDRVEGDQLAVAFPDDRRIDFQVLRIFVVEAGEHLPGKIAHFLDEWT